MTTAMILPLTERFLVEFLAEQDEVTSMVPANRIYTELPREAKLKFPLVRLTCFDDTPQIVRPLVLTEATYQVDCYGGSKALAAEIAGTCRSVIDERIEEYGSAVARWGALRDMPDEVFTPPQPRFIFDVTLLLRAERPIGGSS